MKLKIGTRKSRLAMAQTQMVVNALKNKLPQIETEIVPITTKGDVTLDRPLSSMGGKGVFVGEIEAALRSGKIDAAVHSAKDLPVRLGMGLEISAVLERGDHRDVLVTPVGFEYDMNTKFTVGTGSLRRRISFAKLYKNAVFVDIRGNADTRLRKLSDGGYDGIILAAAGLERLGISQKDGWKFRFFDETEFLPALCQGIIAVECRSGSAAAEAVRKISHTETKYCFETEREIIAAAGGDCSSPIGGFAVVSDGVLTVSLSEAPERVLTGSGQVSDRIKIARELVSRL